VRISGLAALVLAVMLLQDGPASRAREAVLAENADAAAIRALLAFPEVIEDRQVRQKVLRAFSSSDPATYTAALELALAVRRLSADPTVARRLDAAVTGPDAQKKTALLDLALQKGHLADARVLALLADALVDPAAPLHQRTRQIVREHPELQRKPAIAEALDRQPAAFERPAVKLPDFASFQRTVQPILETIGSDDQACSDCHDTHAVLKVLPMDDRSPADEQVRARYRAALRAIDLDAPEKSLILTKPTSPVRAQDGALTHSGGVRFEKGSPPYTAILDWIKTAQ
jgi:hypothetical protein